jgi:hypothetical protein
VTIAEVRILPPLAIARVGSARQPLDNYRLRDAETPLSYREILPSQTLVVDTRNGSLKGRMSQRPITFKDHRNRIRPVAPFLEVVARLEGRERWEPLTVALLRRHRMDVSDVWWRVHVANRKVFRRTGDPDDVVTARTGWFHGHGPKVLEGRCPNFVGRKGIKFGTVRYVWPTRRFPEIRLRFTPAEGLIYGPKRRKKDPVVTRARAVYNPKKRWFAFDMDKVVEEEKNETLPPSLFASSTPAPPWLHGDKAVSRGYLDDTCDGFVEVMLRGVDGNPHHAPDGAALVARARICSAPPAVVPDSVFLRTLRDDLEQVIYGPDVDASDPDVAKRALDIVRRAYETVRFANVEVMNGNRFKGCDPLALDTMPAEEAFVTERLLRPVWPEYLADYVSILALHHQAYTALAGGAAPWFVHLLRQPNQAADLTDRGRRKMPALMCGADNNYLALTHRQINTIRVAAGEPVPRGGVFRQALGRRDRLVARNRSAQLFYEARGNPPPTRPDSAVANCCPGLEFDFRAVWRRIFKGIELREHDNLVLDVDPQLRGTDADVRNHRLLFVEWTRPAGPAGPQQAVRVRVVAQRLGPSPANPDRPVVLATRSNPDGVTALEWSNALAAMLYEKGRQIPSGGRRRRLAHDQGRRRSDRCVIGYFSAEPARSQHVWVDDDERTLKTLKRVELEVRPFFEGDTAVISRELAKAGELTQGLCSPWQNDYRECACFYWASARPDYVNVELSETGGSTGDNWFQKKRTGDYVPDVYTDDERLISYDDLFKKWEKLLRFQVGGRDYPPAGKERKRRARRG